MNSIGSALVLSVLISGSILGQQSSSATQVVTFGVNRTAQMLAKNFASVDNSRTMSSSLVSESVKTQLAKSALKVTLSSNTPDARVTLDNKSLVENRSIVQKDLLSFTTRTARSTVDFASVLLTITD
jgi:hypothetical protein